MNNSAITFGVRSLFSKEFEKAKNWVFFNRLSSYSTASLSEANEWMKYISTLYSECQFIIEPYVNHK
jgi:hypothetical protein